MTIAYAPVPASCRLPHGCSLRPRTFALANGLRVHAFDLPGKGLVSVARVWGVSGLTTPPGGPGGTDPVESLGNGGDLDSTDFARALDALGATINGHAGFDGGVVGMSARKPPISPTRCGWRVRQSRHRLRRRRHRADPRDHPGRDPLRQGGPEPPGRAGDRGGVLPPRPRAAASGDRHRGDVGGDHTAARPRLHAQSVAPRVPSSRWPGTSPGSTSRRSARGGLWEPAGRSGREPYADRRRLHRAAAVARVVDHPARSSPPSSSPAPAIGRKARCGPTCWWPATSWGPRARLAALQATARRSGYTYGASAESRQTSTTPASPSPPPWRPASPHQHCARPLALLDRVRTEGFDADIHARAVNAMTASTVLQFSGARRSCTPP